MIRAGLDPVNYMVSRSSAAEAKGEGWLLGSQRPGRHGAPGGGAGTPGDRGARRGMREHIARMAALLVSVTCSAALSAQLTDTDLPGCYDVAEGAWTESRVRGLIFQGDELLTDTLALANEPIPSSLGGDSAYSQIPPGIRLAAPPAGTTFLGGAAQIIVPEGALPTPHVSRPGASKAARSASRSPQATTASGRALNRVTAAPGRELPPDFRTTSRIGAGLAGSS